MNTKRSALVAVIAVLVLAALAAGLLWVFRPQVSPTPPAGSPTQTPTETPAPSQPSLTPSDTPPPSEPPLPTDTGEAIPWEPVIVGDPMELAWDVSIAPGNGLDQYSIQAYQSEGDAALTTKLVLVNADGITLQTIELDECTSFVSTDNMPYLEDLNMDTYADLVVPTYGTLNPGYRFYVWLPAQSLFEPVEIISGADSTNCLPYYEVNDGYISAWAKESYSKTYYQEYIWLDVKTLSLDSEELISLEEPEQALVPFEEAQQLFFMFRDDMEAVQKEFALHFEYINIDADSTGELICTFAQKGNLDDTFKLDLEGLSAYTDKTALIASLAEELNLSRMSYTSETAGNAAIMSFVLTTQTEAIQGSNHFQKSECGIVHSTEPFGEYSYLDGDWFYYQSVM